jgi:hypothetical protein
LDRAEERLDDGAGDGMMGMEGIIEMIPLLSYTKPHTHTST